MCMTSSSFANRKALYKRSCYPVSHFLWLLRTEAQFPSATAESLTVVSTHMLPIQRLFPNCADHIHFILWVRPLQFSPCWAGFYCKSSDSQLNYESSYSDRVYTSFHFHKLGVNRHQISLGNVHFPVQALLFTFSETMLEYKLPRERDLGSLSHLCILIARLRAR